MELTDRNLLAVMDTYGGKAIVLDDRQYVRRPGETPVSFINRVREEENARQASEAIASAGKTRSAAPSARREGTGEPRADSTAHGEAVQTSKGGLEGAIESQVIDLRGRLETVVEELEKAEARVKYLTAERGNLTKELELAERFLKELTDNANTSKASDKTSGDLPRQTQQEQS